MTAHDDAHRTMRISDADRQVAARELDRAMGEGRITLTEFDERISVVYGAKTFADLEPPLADLPGAVTAVAPATMPAPRPILHLNSEMSTVKRTGDWQVPAQLRLSTSMGSIHLDLTEVRAVPPIVEVDVSTGMGTITVVLPEGSSADVDRVSSSWGTVKSRVPHTRTGSGPHLIFTGSAGMGKLVVRHPRSTRWG